VLDAKELLLALLRWIDHGILCTWRRKYVRAFVHVCMICVVVSIGATSFTCRLSVGGDWRRVVSNPFIHASSALSL
jgi:hypothetical protein